MPIIEDFDKKSNILRLYDYSTDEVNISAPIKINFDAHDYEHILDYIDVDVLVLSDDANDFIFRYSRGDMVNNLFKDYFFDRDVFIGKSFGDVFPDLKKYFYPLFKKAVSTNEKQRMEIIIYKNDSLVKLFNCDIKYSNDELFLIYEDCTHDYFVELYSKSSFFVHDLESNSYNWGNGLEDLFEQALPLDSNMCDLLYNLILPEDLNKLKRIENEITLNDSLRETTCQIRTSKGNIKHLHIILKVIGFYKASKVLYIFKDFSGYKLQDYKLRRFYDALQDVEKAAEISVHYQTANGKYVWNPEVYEIIEREPLADDENHHILLDLLSDEDKKEFMDLVNNLSPNEFLGNHIFPITTCKGNKKYLQVDAHNLYDDEGNFIQRNEYAMNVTDTIKYEQDLIKSDNEKVVLIKESHHRFKNDLQLITNFINLEERFHNEDPKKIIDLTKKRINSLALIHERIYNEYDMKSINVGVFIDDFDKSLFDLAINETKFVNYVDSDFTLTAKIMTPITLIINELTMNSFKYAWDDDFKGERLVTKSFKLYKKDDDDYCEFIYKDNGKGLDDNFDVENISTLGWKVITALSGQIGSEPELIKGEGFVFKLDFAIE